MSSDPREEWLLAAAAQQAEDIAALERDIAERGHVLDGKINPSVREVRQARLALGRLLDFMLCIGSTDWEMERDRIAMDDLKLGWRLHGATIMAGWTVGGKRPWGWRAFEAGENLYRWSLARVSLGWPNSARRPMPICGHR